jgi:hypothetical protein
MFLLAGAVAVGAVLWAAGALSALVAGDRVPRGHPLAGVETLAHFGDPAQAWGSPVGPTGLYWSVASFVMLTIVGLAIVIWRVWQWSSRTGEQDPTRIEGLAGSLLVRLPKPSAPVTPPRSRPNAGALGQIPSSTASNPCTPGRLLGAQGRRHCSMG